MDERLWPECRHRVFYLFKIFFDMTLIVFAVNSCHWLFRSVPIQRLIWPDLLLAEGFCALASGFLWLAFICCLWLSALCALILLLILSLLQWPLCWAPASVNHSLFSHHVSFPPAFHYVTPPVSAMHLGNQEMESDAEDEVNHTNPTMCCPLL